MNRICIAALMTVMICGPGCEPSAQERVEATEKLLSVCDEDIQGSNAYSIMVLIGEGADVNARDRSGKTPLMFAARFSSTPEIVKLLIEANADVNAMSKAGWTPLMFAAGFSSTPEIVTALVAGGAEVNAISKAGWTPLMFAAAFSEPPGIVTLLIEAGADVNAMNDNGFTPLWFANPRFGSTPEIIKILKAAGARE